MTCYPQTISECPRAQIAKVAPDSPAARAGLVPGMCVVAVEGMPLRDLLDWYWLADEYEVELEVTCEQDSSENSLGVTAPSGAEEARYLSSPEAGALVSKDAVQRGRQADSPEDAPAPDTKLVTLERKHSEAWGLEFAEVLFDGLQSCVNTCRFCFMKMLPKGMRSALYVRDDDYRLSFLHGNFVTLTNLSDEDVTRITQMQLSPLNVSLHAIDSHVRTQLMGKNQAHGLDVLERLLLEGILFKAQIVLMPGINDGTILDETLAWIAEHPGITATGIVPYGYTRFAALQQGFDSPESARAVIKQVGNLSPQVQLADEFFIKAWPGELLAHLPPKEYYGDYPLLEDGVGMLRAFLEEYAGSLEACAANRDEPASSLEACAANRDEPASSFQGHAAKHGKPAAKLDTLDWQHSIVATGEAFAAVLHELVPQHAAHIISLKNDFFGGNVDVAGLLTAADVINQIAAAQKAGVISSEVQQLLLPPAMFNDEGFTLDNKTAADVAAALSLELKVLDFM